VTGTIHVSNPNLFAVSNVNVTDAINNGGSCGVTGGTNATIPGNGSKDFDYTCTYSSVPNPLNGTNTATATWPEGILEHSSASGTAGANFSTTTPSPDLHECVTASDNNPGNVTSGTKPSGTICDSTTFDYTVTVSVPHGCVTVNNTATFTATDDSKYTGSDSTTATVCRVPLKTGALTMGFWQNKNGQAIINAANQTNLSNFLKGYHPFSDAPSSGLAAYVSGIIKAATCSGPASAPCNKMLRAQMLATALDVYFSDPALGGNAIKAPAPIGGVSIDLTQICKMIDGSGGTATCSGTYEDASSAFGGASSLTVLQMLAYQNTSDPAADAGAVWYGNNKAMQVLAKDAFDAINNGVAFGP
jgi:hypothetical protein